MQPPAGDTILASCSNEAVPGRVETKCHRAFPPDTAYTEPVVLDVFSQRPTHSDQNRRHARDVRFLWPHRSLVPRRSRSALAQAKSGPRAASSGLPLRSNQDRRDAPGVRLLRPNRGLVPRQADFLFGQIGTDAMLQACVCSSQIGASCRVKRTFASVTTISDRLGSRAPNAIRAEAVTYPAEGHFEDYAPLKGVA
jgi:hypothetical protein